jgi:hypothetical protein
MGIAAERLEFGLGDIVEHLKTGNLYMVFAIAKMEKDLEEVIVYVEASKNGPLPKGNVWVRPKKEMYDGRFIKTYYGT